MIWKPHVQIARSADQPLFLQIVEGIARDIERGRLVVGDTLPGARTLAEMFGVHRNTVTAALQELESQGWITMKPRRRAFVAGPTFPATMSQSAPASCATEVVAFELAPAPAPEPAYATLSAQARFVLAGGRPDARLIPTEALARAYRRALRRLGPELLDYGDAAGRIELRSAVARMLREARGIPAGPDDLVITRGAQHALSLTARTLVRPGDCIAVEALGYPPAWAAFRASGARLCPVQVDEHGIDVEELERLVKRRRVRAVYVTPHHQFPTMVVMHPARRARLLELCRRHRVAIIEDDYDNEHHYEGRPVTPLASEDHGGTVIYVGTLSKVLAPGLRVGYLVAPRRLLEHVVFQRAVFDRQGDHAMEVALAELIDDGEIRRHTRRMRREYAARRLALVAALEHDLGDRVQFDVPPGGMSLWVRLNGDVTPSEWAKAALARGVAFLPGRECAFDRREIPYVRMGYARLSPAEIREAVRRSARVLSPLSKKGRC